MSSVRPAFSPIDMIAAVLVASGIAVRARDLSFPARLMFDEHHFVENARNYLAGRADWNDHPPLGKLFIALSIHLFGDTSLAWRLPALLCGILTIVLTGVAIARLFGNTRAGLITAALISADGFFISYSRAALLDGFLVCCAALALFIVSLRWNLLTAALAGTVAGVACSTKFSGIGLVATVAFAALLSELTPRKKLAALAVIAAAAGVTYFAIFGFGLSLAGKSGDPREVFAETQRLLALHATSTKMMNPMISRWPTWFVPMRPIMMGIFREGADLRVQSTLGNLVIWWSANLLVVSLLITAVWKRLGFVDAHGRKTLVLIAGAMMFLAPWVFSRHDSYIYHYLPTYFFLTALLGGFVGWVAQFKRMTALAYLLAVLFVFAFYAPAWSFSVISESGFDARFPFSGWRW